MNETCNDETLLKALFQVELVDFVSKNMNRQFREPQIGKLKISIQKSSIIYVYSYIFLKSYLQIFKI